MIVAESRGGAPGPRVDALRRLLATSAADAILVSAPVDVRYLSGFTGSNGWLLLGRDRLVLLTDGRYVDQAVLQAPQCELVVAQGPLANRLALVLGEAGRVVFDPAVTTCTAAEALRRQVPTCEWVPREGLCRELRAVKEGDEIHAMRRALRVAESALVEVVEQVRPGQTEAAVAALLDHQCRLGGASAMAFETIVAAGVNGARPHSRPGDRLLIPGDVLVVDLGCVVDGYCSDITRAVAVAQPPSAQWRRIHAAVDEARRAGIAAIAPGVEAHAVDAAARATLVEAGFGDLFVHSLGHGVGLEIHEWPRLASSSSAALREGMVVTIEPGVYIPGEGGLRLEDMVVVTATGGERLNALDTAFLSSPEAV